MIFQVRVLSAELFETGLTHNSTLTTENSAKRSVSHLGSQRICSNSVVRETDNAPTMGALCSNGFVVEHLILIRFQPHELGALWAASDLRRHRFPRTLQNIERDTLV